MFQGLLLRQASAEHGFHAPEPAPDLQVAARVPDAVTEAAGRLDLRTYLESFERRADRVAVFVALLEMMRRRWVDAVTRGRSVRISLLVDTDALSSAQVASILSRGEEGLA